MSVSDRVFDALTLDHGYPYKNVEDVSVVQLPHAAFELVVAEIAAERARREARVVKRKRHRRAVNAFRSKT